MPIQYDEPLRKVTMNFFEKDIAELERRHGPGWTERIRQLLRNHIKDTGGYGEKRT